MDTSSIAAGAGAILLPTFAGSLLARVPGGLAGQMILGVGLIYGGSKVKEGLVKPLLVGAGAGIVLSNLAALVIGQKARASA
jgi:hypothetical protein